MREIKFSCMWTNGVDWMDLRYTLEQMENGEHFDAVDNLPILVDYELKHKRQYTGLKDSNGVEIYEGDIVCSPYVSKEFPVWINAATFVNGSWVLLNGDDFELMGDICSGVEVIGDIHQNPELLED